MKYLYIDGCSLFLFELVKDNNILIDEAEVIYLSNKILTKIEKLSTSNLNKTILLATLTRMITYKGYLIEENQNKILSAIISKTRKNLLINFKDPAVKNQII